MGLLLRSKLSIMMLLQYAVWGVWLPILPVYLGTHLQFSQIEIGMIVGAAAAIGAITAPFISGQLADRYFSTERFLGISLILGGICMWLLAGITTFWPAFALWIVYSIIYVPTISLTNSLSFHHLPNAEKDFSSIRVFGTVGWIAVGWAFASVVLDRAGEGAEAEASAQAACMTWSAVISIVYGVFCFTLPHTPPKAKAGEGAAPLKALRLLKNPSFLVLFLVSFPISIIHTWYFIWTSPFLIDAGIDSGNVFRIMSIGQVSEVIILSVVVGILNTRFGLKKTILVGIMAYVCRFLLFSVGQDSNALLCLSIAFHGFCFGCFYVSSFIFVDKVCDEDIRASAQTLFAIFILGVGPAVSGPLAGLVKDFFMKADGTYNYFGLWLVPTSIAAAALLFFAIFFKYEEGEPKPQAVEA